MTGKIILFSSVPKLPFSPACGFNPEIINLGFSMLKSL